MKKTKLKILFTALSFLALSSAFSQDTTNVSTTPGDSLNNSVPQASPMATDSTNASSTQTWSSDSTSANSSVTEGQSKADKKREKAGKKEEKAIKKEEKAGQ